MNDDVDGLLAKIGGEAIRETLDAGMQSDVDDIDERWVRSLREDVVGASVSVNCSVAEKSITLRDVMNLEPGVSPQVRARIF